MYRVKKRDGRVEEFDISKVVASIGKAFGEEDSMHPNPAPSMVALHVAADYEPQIMGDVVTSEQIRSSVIKVLTDAGYTDEAAAYSQYKKPKNIDEWMFTSLKFYKEYAI